MIKRYSELIAIDNFKDRFEYLKLEGNVGIETYGYDRYLNQIFYKSPEWKKFRNDIIIRDNGCDLAFEDYEIVGKILIHHLNPITKDDILQRRECLMDPENVVCTSHKTHNAIHYGDESMIFTKVTIRTPGDTKLW